MRAAGKLRFVAPLAIFAVLLGFLGYRLFLVERGFAPDLIPPALINKPAPKFGLPSLFANDPPLQTKDLKGKVTLVNFFASWCVPCKVEHPYLSQVTRGTRIELIGVVYKDRPEDASLWLAELGDPYKTVVIDAEGRTGIDFGVYGLPESYLIDKQGVIRFKQTGPLTPDVIETQLIPLANSLNR